ncbi:E3 ubiquitin-protein ligase complex SLX5-SLX8 subunit SLX8-like [Vicia villosa]|uniref:E3 ubiquitin-protein ligase complex SLX5-SLX8 subunit SLX8-like n=1 Tax=Vicia villosa TaxID=3911 RepID=UPI00273C15BA|nr:E3 ubiquitin-protein ligase complex SLX5-SLX8 subunit SLX8-like [Vicia villosa]
MSNRQRKRNLLLDLNNIALDESSHDEGASESIYVPINYLEEIDDDVVECSPRDFAQAVANAGRTRKRIAIDLNLEYQPMPTPVENYRENMENSTLPSENIENPTIPTPVMNYTENITEPIGQSNINLEVIINEVTENDKTSPEANKEVSDPNIQVVEPPKEPEPPKDLILTCPICMEAFVEAMSTVCGHIFCKICIKKAISRQKKCPTCRKKLTCRGLRRVFIPSSS